MLCFAFVLPWEHADALDEILVGVSILGDHLARTFPETHKNREGDGEKLLPTKVPKKIDVHKYYHRPP